MSFLKFRYFYARIYTVETMSCRNLTHGVNGLELYATIDDASFNNGEQKMYRATWQEIVRRNPCELSQRVEYHGRCASVDANERT